MENIVRVLPDADGDCAVDLRRKLAPVAAGVTIDLSHVPYLSAAALTELVRFRKRVPGEAIVLREPNPLTLRTLNIVGFNALFQIDRARS